jgi:hypothetical protein
MNAAGRAMAHAQGATTAKCFRLSADGALPPGVDPQQCLELDLQGRVARAAAATIGQESLRCFSTPNFGFAGAAATNDAARQASLDIIADVFGSDLELPFGEHALSCQSGMAKNLHRLLDAELREFLTCKKRGLRDGSITSTAGLEACMELLNGDASTRILGRLDRIEADESRDCDFFTQDQYFPGRCVYYPQLLSCIDARVRCRTCEMLNAVDSLSADCELLDDEVENGSCTADCPPEQIDCAGFCNGPFVVDHDGTCCNGAELDACGFCNGTGYNCDWTQVAVGGEFACGLRGDGSIDCWGGFGPEMLPPPGVFTQVVAGGDSPVSDQHACALRDDGSVACWGDNDFGQTAAPPGTFDQLCSGRNHACALRPDGSVECWGANHLGQATPPGGTFVHLACAVDLSCGLHADGTPECWGSNTDNQLDELPGPFTALFVSARVVYGLNPDGTVVRWGLDYPQYEPPAGVFTQVAASSVGACGLRVGGAVECWGAPLTNEPPPTSFLQVSAGDQRRYCGVRNDGIIFCWDNAAFEPPPR